MFKVVLVGGYCGADGEFIARKTIHLPFIPYVGLEIVTPTDEIHIHSVEWHTESESFHCQIDDYEWGCFADHKLRMSANGWEVHDEHRI